MMLYGMDELVDVLKDVGANDLDGPHVVAYEILAFALLHCTEQHSSAKKQHNTLGDAYP